MLTDVSWQTEGQIYLFFLVIQYLPQVHYSNEIATCNSHKTNGYMTYVTFHSRYAIYKELFCTVQP